MYLTGPQRWHRTCRRPTSRVGRSTASQVLLDPTRGQLNRAPHRNSWSCLQKNSADQAQYLYCDELNGPLGPSDYVFTDLW